MLMIFEWLEILRQFSSWPPHVLIQGQVPSLGFWQLLEWPGQLQEAAQEEISAFSF